MELQTRKRGSLTAAAEGGPARDRGERAFPSPLIPAAFFLSGFAALLYELLWFRMLGHVFGSTATATATLLAAYLFGLGLGAWIFGRIADRSHRVALVYVATEIGIGLYGLASHALLTRSAVLYAAAHAWAGENARLLLASRFAVSFLLIALPTTLMGGTFPLMVELLRSRTREAGRTTARAYAVNTAGAALGAVALPTLILPHLGIGLSLLAAAVCNLGAAAAVYGWVARTRARRETGNVRSAAAGAVVVPAQGGVVPGVSSAEARPGIAADARPGTPPSLRPRTDLPLLAGFFLSSFAALSLETVWARHFGIFFGTQTTTFAFILFAYLVGLFLGGAIYARFAARGASAGSLLRAGFLLSAATIGITIPFLDRLPLPQIALLSAFGVSNGSFTFTAALETLIVILPPAVGFGLAFPAVVGLLAREGRGAGASVALTYAVNTLGTTLGSIGAGFWLIPTLGSQRTFEISVLLVAAGLLLATLSEEMELRAQGRTEPDTRRESRTGGSRTGGSRTGRSILQSLLRFGIPALFLVLLLLPRWDWRLAHGMYSKDPVTFVKNYKSGELKEALATYRVPFLDEGTEATASVLEYGDQGRRSLFINGKPDASNIPDDMVAQRLLGLVPALFHPNLRDALVIGLGSGCTVATLKRFPLERLDAAEIAPGVARAAREYFADINDRFLEDPRVRLRLDDGRNYLHFQPAGSYDLIVSEPSNPWTAGVSALFTDEFFAEAREKLRDGGVLCQWFHYYNMSLDHIRLLVRSFARHFPDAALFLVQGDRPTGDLLLVGSKGPLRLARLPEDPSLPEGVRSALAEVKNPTLDRLLRGLSLGPEDIAAFAGTGPINTDDRPILEFEAPADRFHPTFVPNYRALLTARERVFLAVGPGPEEEGAETALARSGFALPGGFPPGEERRRGALVLEAARPGGREIDRWVLTGSEFRSEDSGTSIDSGGSGTSLYSLARLPRGDEEVREIARLLAQGRQGAEGIVTAHGHPALWVAPGSAGEPSVVCAWACPESDRTYFVCRSGSGAGGDAEACARDLAARFTCRHGEAFPAK